VRHRKDVKAGKPGKPGKTGGGKPGTDGKFTFFFKNIPPKVRK
jgi:hypothetical protein